MTTSFNGIPLNSLVGDGVKSNEVDVAPAKLKSGGVSIRYDLPNYDLSTLVVATESGTDITTTLTLKDESGVAIAGVRGVEGWLSSSATTGAIATDDTITLTASTGLLIKEHTDDLYFKAVTDVNGVLAIVVSHAGDATAKYLYLETAGFRKPKISTVIDNT